MAKATDTKPEFDVSKTDKRNDKRVLIDFVTASNYAPDLLPLFDEYADELNEQLQIIADTEGAQPVLSPVDTAIAQQKELIEARYTGEYSDYVLKQKAASYFLPKSGRVRKSPEEKQRELVDGATPEQLASLAALLRERGYDVADVEV